MKKLLLSFLLIVIILSTSIQVYAGYYDEDSTSAAGVSGLWHYGYNYLGTVTEQGSEWRIPYSAYTTVLDNYMEMNGVMMLWGSGSTGFVLDSFSTDGYGTISFVSTEYPEKSSSYDTVAFAVSHDGYLSDDKIVWDWHGSTYTSCDLPSSKSESRKEDLYDRVKKADINLASTLNIDTDPLTYSSMLDWSNFASVVPFFKEYQDALDSFERLVMCEVFGVHIVAGDTTPSFWFDEDNKEMYIVFTKKCGEAVLLSSQLINDLQSENREFRWSTPI